MSRLSPAADDVTNSQMDRTQSACTDASESQSGNNEWEGQIFIRNALVCRVHGHLSISLPTELHICTRIPVGNAIQLFKGLPASSREQNVSVLRPRPQHEGRFKKLRTYLSSHKSAGIVHIPDPLAVFYLIPSSDVTCQALELKDTEGDGLICFLIKH